MCSNLSYQQASANANRKALAEYNIAVMNGKTTAEAQEVARIVYEAEMKYYESGE